MRGWLASRCHAIERRYLGYTVFGWRIRLRNPIRKPLTGANAGMALPVLQLTLPELDQVGYAPLDGTFAASAEEPFQRWYPYLEGYSSDFVRKTVARFAPDATTILDPFGGTGTTAFVAAELGLDSYLCEVNPVLQFLFDTKASLRCSPRSVRLGIANRLSALAPRVASSLARTAPDPGLLATYRASFGNSRYYTDESLHSVAQLRTFIDELLAADSPVAQLVTVAALASLLPASFLKRAGDVRFMTEKELRQGVPPLVDEVTRNLRRIQHDLENLTDRDTVSRAPVRISGDARTLRDIPPLGADLLVTSPPYINGTNYFRNTRLELWFLRCLRSVDDLGRLRKLAVTAGINDVTTAKAAQSLRPAVQAVVEALAVNAYDPRIPLMVGSYFAEMEDIFQGLSHHLVDRATVAVDIGDSNYGGVHVPADALITDALGKLGFELRDEVVLRQRRSKNGAPLRQVLLVYRYSKRRLHAVKVAPGQAWSADWAAFCSALPHQQQPFASRSWGNSLHSLCSYPGKLKPAIAHHLVSVFSGVGDRILDPFAGAGTIPFEGALNGREAFGLELSPAAYPIGAAKVTIPGATETDTILGDLERFLAEYHPSTAEQQEASGFGLNGKIADFYHPRTLNEVLAARRFFLSRNGQSPSDHLVLAACLHVLHGNRPYAASRRSHPLTPYKPTGPTEYRPLLPRIAEKVARSKQSALPGTFVGGKVYLQDATAWWPSDINNIAAVITSPPFFDSTRFHVQNWLRLWFAGWPPEAFQYRHRLFMDERQKVTFAVYESILRQSRDRLRSGGVVVLHLGKSVKCDMAKELASVGKRWFARSEIFDESVLHCESHGLRDKGTVTSHQYLLLY